MSALSRILVATDYSPGAGAALARAGELAKEHHAELRIIHASPDWNLFSRSMPAQQAHYASLTQHAESAMRHDIEWLQQKLSIRARGEVHLGSATLTILRLAAEFQPQLLVIGARGEHGPPVAPAVLGGTALKLLAQTTRPLLLVRGTDHHPYREAMVAVSDAGELGQRIVDWGMTLAPGAACHLIRAYDVPYLERLRQCGIDDPSMISSAAVSRASAQHEVDSLLKSIDGSARIRAHLMPGEPLGVILTQIVRDRVQLLAVGKHVERVTESVHALVGSVGLRLAYHAPVDVLVVP